MIKRWLAGLLTLGVCAAASALSVGELKIRSAVGGAFEAALPFSANADEAVSPQCIRALDDGSSPNQHVPLLGGLRFEVVHSAGGGEIVIRTRALVNEPVVRVRLAINCAPKGSLVREFVVLLDAPGTMAPAASATAVVVSPVVQAAVPRRAAAPAAGRGPAASGGAPTAGKGRPANVNPAGGLASSLRIGAPPVQAAGGAPGKVRQPPAMRAQGHRLTLSKPQDREYDDPLILPLRRSDELSSLSGPPRENAASELEGLRLEARIRLSENPIAEAARMQTRLSALETGMTGLRKELGEIEASRKLADDRVRRLTDENRRLSAWLNGVAMFAAFLVCAALLALVIWRYRVAAERRGLRARSWPVEPRTAAEHVPEVPSAEPEPLDASTAATPRMAAPPRAAAAASPTIPPPAPKVANPAPVATEPQVVEFERTVSLDRRAALAAGNAKPVATAAAKPAAGKPAVAPRDATQMPSPPVAPAVSPSEPVPVTRVVREDDLYLPESAVLTRTARGARLEQAEAEESAQKLHETTLDLGSLRDNPPRLEIDFVIEDQGPLGQSAATDPEARARAESYFAEFERKLFPEIALGRVKLDDPRSIIGLARTYYQEDFDAAKAISFLEYALYRSAEPMAIHLALLEVLRMERRVGEYAVVARAFRGQYPDSATHWQLIAAYGRLMDPNEPTFEGEKVPGLDLDTPSNWLGSTLDMTKYVLGQKVSDSVRDLPLPVPGAPR